MQSTIPTAEGFATRRVKSGRSFNPDKVANQRGIGQIERETPNIGTIVANLGNVSTWLSIVLNTWPEFEAANGTGAQLLLYSSRPHAAYSSLPQRMRCKAGRGAAAAFVRHVPQRTSDSKVPVRL